VIVIKRPSRRSVAELTRWLDDALLGMAIGRGAID